MAEGAAAGAMDGGEKMRCVLRERHWRRGACSRWRARARAGAHLRQEQRLQDSSVLVATVSAGAGG
jgi:hypothetical protein